jgi:hypothetical protein
MTQRRQRRMSPPFRFIKSRLGWNKPLRAPAAADRWTRLIIACYAQLYLAEGKGWPVSADSTVVRAHQRAAGARCALPAELGHGGHHRMTRIPRAREALDRSRGGLSTKIRPHASARFQLAGNGVGCLPGRTGPRLCAIVRDRRHGAPHARLLRDTRRQ